jgi:DNA-damage-inducible protein D
MARDIQELLEYDKWDNFQNVIDKAKTACQNALQPILNHFADASKMVQVG